MTQEIRRRRAGATFRLVERGRQWLLFMVYDRADGSPGNRADEIFLRRYQ